MKFVFDECCDESLVEHMRKEGHDAVYIREMKPGVPDTEVLLLAKRDERILVTEDKDFGELVYRLKKPAYGVILLRFHPLEKNIKQQRLSRLAKMKSHKLQGNFIVADSEKVRIRSLNK